LAPEDFLGLKRLAEVSASLGISETAVILESFAGQSDGRATVAKLLNLSVEDVELGPNLVDNGDFGSWEDTSPQGWRFWTYLGPDGDRGQYANGEDSLIPEGNTARIVALWGGPATEGTRTYAEYISDSLPMGGTRYLLSIYYSSQNSEEGNTFVFVGEYERRNGTVLVRQMLPDSRGQWRVAHILVDTAITSSATSLLVRMWGVGDLRIWAAELKPIIVVTEGSSE
jgi:hypothetical protein